MIGVNSVNIRLSDVDVDARATDVMAFYNFNFWVWNPKMDVSNENSTSMKRK